MQSLKRFISLLKIVKNPAPRSTIALIALWRNYASLIERRNPREPKSLQVGEIWKDVFFVQTVKFVLPLSALAYIGSAAVEYRQGHYLTLVADTSAYAGIIWLLLSPSLGIRRKKGIGIGVIAILSLVKIITLQSLTIGSIFLLLGSVLATLLYGFRIAYLSVLFNSTCCLLTIYLLDYLFFPKTDYTRADIFGRWMLYTFNFLFVNFTIVAIIRRLTGSFERSIVMSKALSAKLRIEIAEKTAKEKLLQESAMHYKRLFFLSPLPMLIYDPLSLEILDANKATIEKYGYLAEELQGMKVNDLPKREDSAFRKLRAEENAKSSDVHYSKSGKKILVEIDISKISMKGSWVKLAVIRDITKEAIQRQAIEQKDEKMKKIAFLQSHVIRSPLARIIGIVQLMQGGAISTTEFPEYLGYLGSSAKELDSVITEIVGHTKER